MNSLPSRRAYALGVWGTIGALTGLCGSPIAAVMIELFNWQAIFILTGVFALLILIAGLIVLSDEQEGNNQLPIDWVSAIFAVMAVGGLTLFLCSRPRMGIQFTSDAPLFMHFNDFNATFSQTQWGPKTSDVSTSYISQRSFISEQQGQRCVK